jgi:AcrR family transcriptional regulator
MSLIEPDQVEPDLNAVPGARLGRDPARAIKRGPSQLPPEVVQATQRSRLLDGLVHTVAEKGYADARVSDICQAAGVTRPAFYALFKGKDDAFVAAYKHGVKVLFSLMDRAHSAAPDWHSGAHEALRVLLEVLSSVPAFATTAVVEVEAVGPAGRQERSKMLLRCGRYFTAAPWQVDVPHGEDMVMAVVGGIHAAIYRYVAHDRVTQLPELLPTLSYFATAPFLGAAAARRGPSEPHPLSGRTSLPCVQTHENAISQSLSE